MKFVTMTGMSRSGNHGIIRWLVGHYEEAGYSVYFYNNTVVAFLEHINFIMSDVDKLTKKVFIVSLEDVIINERFSKMSALADHNILLVRDPANLFASRLAGLAPDRGLALPENATEKDKIFAASVTSKALPSQVDKYMNHYGEFSGKTNFLKNKICVSYNRWVAEDLYRKELVEGHLNLKFSDTKYKTRAGSSFGKAPSDHEDYFQRWKTCWDSFPYRQIRENNTLMNISVEFGVNTGA